MNRDRIKKIIAEFAAAEQESYAVKHVLQAKQQPTPGEIKIYSLSLFLILHISSKEIL